MSHFAGMSVVQRKVLHGLLNTQSFRDQARSMERNGYPVSWRAVHWERAAVAAGLLVELTDMMVALKDPCMGPHDISSARLLFDTIVKEIKEHGHHIHDAPFRGFTMGGRPVVAPAVHPQGAQYGGVLNDGGRQGSGPDSLTE